MNPIPDSIAANPLLFDKLCAPLQPLLLAYSQEPLSQAAKKLSLPFFVRLLRFRRCSQSNRRRDLGEERHTNPAAKTLGLTGVGWSTLQDGLVRYRLSGFGTLALSLSTQLALGQIAVVEPLGQFFAVASSLWPVYDNGTGYGKEVCKASAGIVRCRSTGFVQPPFYSVMTHRQRQVSAAIG